MGLRSTAESDLEFILEDADTGFGWNITMTNPAGITADLVGFSDDISQVIDPDTGQAVSGRLASVALRITSLALAGLGLPQAIAGTAGKPWLVTFDSISGETFTFKVAQSNPDRALGVVTCVLEFYRVGV
jgi:hypothetical protein